jgi:hypothetical protein
MYRFIYKKCTYIHLFERIATQDVPLKHASIDVALGNAYVDVTVRNARKDVSARIASKDVTVHASQHLNVMNT